ncbi:hypothetical protein FKW77_009775 [Venturia effusa]|uniref:Uncharacterized protein n=1 Tax=Venturia effusa TaxID=50376 RepID=A0A517LEQ1_9PEZI|nr:hypothetical protein FKW77_009775 [Venturia effusa]
MHETSATTSTLSATTSDTEVYDYTITETSIYGSHSHKANMSNFVRPWSKGGRPSGSGLDASNVTKTKTIAPGPRPTAHFEDGGFYNYDDGNAHADSHGNGGNGFRASPHWTSPSSVTTAAPKDVYSNTGEKVNSDGSYVFGNKDGKLGSPAKSFP